MTIPSNRSGSSKGEKLAQRISHILAVLHQGDRISKHDLARQFEVDVRTIERDLNERLYGIVERNHEGLWQLTHSARSSIPANHLHRYARMAGTEHLFPDASLKYLLEQLETPEPDRAALVQAISYEDLRPHTTLFTQLQSAIENQQECCFTYKGKARRVQPYRLIHRIGVWYLAAVENGKLKNFSASLIRLLELDETSRFTPEPAHHDYINGKDDVWFTADTTEVLLRVTAEVAHYFTRRDLLPQQQHRFDPDGSLLVTTQISHVNQLLPVVRYWLPNVRILQPTKWHEELLTTLKSAIAQWES